jgi:hypothetical protein
MGRLTPPSNQRRHPSLMEWGAALCILAVFHGLQDAQTWFIMLLIESETPWLEGLIMPFENYEVPTLMAENYGRVWHASLQPPELQNPYDDVAIFLEHADRTVPVSALREILAHAVEKATLRYLPCTPESLPAQKIAGAMRKPSGVVPWGFFRPITLGQGFVKGYVDRRLGPTAILKVVTAHRISA